MKYILIVLFILLFINCKQKPFCNVNAELLRYNDSTLLKAKNDKFLSQFLTKMKEPELEDLNEETYRFIIIGPWGDNKIYRISKDSTNYLISHKIYRKYYEDTINLKNIEIDSLSPEFKTPINLSDWKEIKESISELNFWTLPVRIEEGSYLDGTGYVIEGYTPQKNKCTNRNYQATQRISPIDTTLYKSIFHKVIKLAE